MSTDIPSFYKDYSNLSSLASALGEASTIPNGTNLNDIKDNRVHHLNIDYNYTNAPVKATGILISEFANSPYGAHIVFTSKVKIS